MNKLTDTEIGYLAGLFDGEGWFVTHKRSVSMHMASTDFDVITWVHETTGIGTVTGPFRRGSQKKDQMQWNVGVYDDIVDVINSILVCPFSKRRTDRANEVLAEIQTRKERAEWRESHFICGHDMVEDNTYRFPLTGPNSGKTACRQCSRDRSKARYLRNKEA